MTRLGATRLPLIVRTIGIADVAALAARADARQARLADRSKRPTCDKGGLAEPLHRVIIEHAGEQSADHGPRMVSCASGQ
jgi:hypothetical protein